MLYVNVVVVFFLIIRDCIRVEHHFLGNTPLFNRYCSSAFWIGGISCSHCSVSLLKYRHCFAGK